MTDDQQKIRAAMSAFPEYFGLEAYPGDAFYISPSHSYVSGDRIEFHVFRRNEKRSKWELFCKTGPAELKEQLGPVPLRIVRADENHPLCVEPPIEWLKDRAEALRAELRDVEQQLASASCHLKGRDQVWRRDLPR